MRKKLRIAIAAAVLSGCVFIVSCSDNKADNTQGFTQSLEEEQQKADDALEEFEKASEALDKAIENTE